MLSAHSQSSPSTLRCSALTPSHPRPARPLAGALDARPLAGSAGGLQLRPSAPQACPRGHRQVVEINKQESLRA
eukprot:378022-Prorocentrum_minimum.AAC.1